MTNNESERDAGRLISLETLGPREYLDQVGDLLTKDELVHTLAMLADEIEKEIGGWKPGCTAYTPKWLTEAYYALDGLRAALTLLQAEQPE